SCGQAFYRETVASLGLLQPRESLLVGPGGCRNDRTFLPMMKVNTGGAEPLGHLRVCLRGMQRQFEEELFLAPIFTHRGEHTGSGMRCTATGFGVNYGNLRTVFGQAPGNTETDYSSPNDNDQHPLPPSVQTESGSAVGHHDPLSQVSWLPRVAPSSIGPGRTLCHHCMSLRPPVSCVAPVHVTLGSCVRITNCAQRDCICAPRPATTGTILNASSTPPMRAE